MTRITQRVMCGQYKIKYLTWYKRGLEVYIIRETDFVRRKGKSGEVGETVQTGCVTSSESNIL